MSTTLVKTRSIWARLGLLSVALGVWAVVAACSSSGGKKPVDASNQDGLVLDFKFGELPEGCPPAAGNENRVGTPCSKTASMNQCGGGLICACQEFLGVHPPDDTPCFCTIPILRADGCASLPAGFCGTGATCCSYLNQGAICVPDVCLPQMQCPAF